MGGLFGRRDGSGLMSDDREEIRLAAERWFSRRCDGALASEEEAEFRRWLESSGGHARAFDDVQLAWKRLALLKESRLAQGMADEAWREGCSEDMYRERRATSRKLLLVACVAIMALAGILQIFPGRHASDPSIAYATRVGEQRTQRLSDGSEVLLNTDTYLEVVMSRGRRELHLRRGEAVFDVAKDEKKPFVVTVGDGTVTALGTRFLVRALDAEVTVNLLEGSVEVAREGQNERRRLAPGQRAAYVTAERGISVGAFDADVVLGWTEGRLEFDGSPLSAVIAEANRYSATKLRLVDPALAGMPVSGTFKAGSNDDLAAGLVAVYDLRITNDPASGEIWIR